MGPFRVWFKFGIGPGLAMTRTFGDTLARKIGVISEPGIYEHLLIEIARYEINESFKTLVLASDGIWDQMTNDDVANFVFPYYERNDLQNVAQDLLNEAHKRWEEKKLNPDDITCIVIFLKEKVKNE